MARATTGVSVDVLRAQLSAEQRVVAREESLRVEGRLLDLLDRLAADPPPAVCRSDAVAEMFVEAQRRPGSTIERAIASILTVDAAPGTAASIAPSPFTTWATPLLDALARADRLAGVRMHARFPSGLVADVVGPPGEKVELPSAPFAIDPDPPDTTKCGLVLDVSLMAATFMSDNGRAGLIGDYLLAQSRAKADAVLAAAIDADAADAADFDAAVAALAPPFSARVVAGPLTDLAALDVLAYDRLGVRFVPDPNLPRVVVLDPAAVDAGYAETGLLVVYEPNVVGLLVSSALDLAVTVDPAGVVAVGS